MGRAETLLEAGRSGRCTGMAAVDKPIHVRRSWKAMLASEAEALTFARCWECVDRSSGPVRVHPVALGGASVTLRPGTTDAQVLDDTFVGLYHLPPIELSADAVILDLGANVGFTAAHFAVLSPRGRIVCVEMDAGNAAMARENLAGFGARCEVIEAAAWDRDGWMEYGGAEEWGYRVAGLGEEVPRAGGARVRCRAVSMDGLVERLGLTRIDYAKVDIEGAEAAVVRADARWLRVVRAIKVEYHEPATRESIGAALAGAGMSISDDARHPRCVVGVRR